jgi:hypothetical protein
LKFKKIILYDEPSVSEIKISKLIDFLKNNLLIEIELKENIFKEFNNEQIKNLSSTRVSDTQKPFHKHESNLEELEFENKLCQDSSIMDSTTKVEDAKQINDVLMYDGFELQKNLRYLINKNDTLHIVFTNRLICTYDYKDSRYHGRTVICANPGIISITGIVEAPAKSREYYLDVISNKSQGLDLDAIKNKHKGTFIDYHDERLAHILEGYLLQVIFYNITGDAFCENIECRLNNSHWQKDVLYSQIKIGKLCNKHQEIIDKVNMI